MSNLVFAGAPNRADEATLTAGSAVATLPVAHLQDRQIVKPWRTATTQPASTWVQADFGQPQTIGVVALIRHNFSQGSRWRLRLGDDPSFAVVAHDSGWVEVWPQIEEFGALPWGVFQWGGLVPQEVAAQITLSAHYLLPVPVVAQHLRLDIDDAGNPAGYLQAGRLVAGPAYRPSRDLLYGWSIGFEDPSVVSKSRGGQTWIDVQERFRVLRFTLANLNETEAFVNVFDYLHRRKGIAGDVLVIPRADRPDQFHNQAIYGRLRTLEPLTHPYWESFETNFEVEELL
ncbi:MAG TPA: hypothetical protein DD490_11855 [Acidobacteria bacterium]|nr:hypothetical protein [Acidobacteriota bacterium]